MSIDHNAAFWVEDAKIEFAVAVEQRMQRLDINRTELADRLGTSKGNVTKLLRGDTNLTIESMSRIAHALGGKVQMQIVAEDNRMRWVEIIQKSHTAAAPSANIWQETPNKEKHAVYA